MKSICVSSAATFAETSSDQEKEESEKDGSIGCGYLVQDHFTSLVYIRGQHTWPRVIGQKLPS